MRTVMLATLLVLNAAGSLPAQRLERSPLPSMDEPEYVRRPQPPGKRTPPPTDIGWLIGGGLLAGATGGVAGMFAGATLTSNGCEDCAIVGAVYGVAAGVSSG
jgi:hypothetical protein